VEDELPVVQRERTGALGGRNGLVMGPLGCATKGQKEIDLPQSTRIAEGRGEALSFTQIGHDTLLLPRRRECIAQGQAQVDRLLAGVACLW
jgi:hypothetical protein